MSTAIPDGPGAGILLSCAKIASEHAQPQSRNDRTQAQLLVRLSTARKIVQSKAWLSAKR